MDTVRQRADLLSGEPSARPRSRDGTGRWIGRWTSAASPTCDAAPSVSLSGGEKQRAMLACLVAHAAPSGCCWTSPSPTLDDASAAAIAAKLRLLHRGAGHGHSGGGSPARPLDWHRRHPVLLPGRRHRPGRPWICTRPDPARLEQAGVIAPGVSYAPDLAPAEPGDVVLRS